MLNAPPPFWACLHVPSPHGEAQITSVSGLSREYWFFSVCIHQFFMGSLEYRQTWRLLFVWEAMVTRDFMRSFLHHITFYAIFFIEGGKPFSWPLRRMQHLVLHVFVAPILYTAFYKVIHLRKGLSTVCVLHWPFFKSHYCLPQIVLDH